MLPEALAGAGQARASSLIGVGSTVIISLVVGWNWEFSASAVILGIATAVAIGLAFGYFPARQAAKLDPITALRAL